MWQSVPYLFADFFLLRRGDAARARGEVDALALTRLGSGLNGGLGPIFQAHPATGSRVTRTDVAACSSAADTQIARADIGAGPPGTI